MTPGEFKALYEENNPDGHYFDRDTMRHFGDTLGNLAIVWEDVTDTLCKGDDKRPDTQGWCVYRKRTTRKGAPHGFLTAFDAKAQELIGYSPVEGVK